MNQSEHTKRIEAICKELNKRSKDVGVAISRLEIAKALADSESASAAFYRKTENLRIENTDLRVKNTGLQAENTRLRTALEQISKQHKTDEMETEGDIEYGYDAVIDVAREALKGGE